MRRLAGFADLAVGPTVRFVAGTLAGTLAACSAPSDADAPAVPVDSAFVGVLADVHLADARAALAPDSSRRTTLADSLRGVALGVHGLDRDRFEARLRDLADDPGAAVATYDAVGERLAADRLPTAP